MTKKKSPKAITEQTPKLPKKKYLLKRDVTIGDALHKRGTQVELTEKGREFFKIKNYI